jgi:hypothetical protein
MSVRYRTVICLLLPNENSRSSLLLLYVNFTKIKELLVYYENLVYESPSQLFTVLYILVTPHIGRFIN